MTKKNVRKTQAVSVTPKVWNPVKALDTLGDRIFDFPSDLFSKQISDRINKAEELIKEAADEIAEASGQFYFDADGVEMRTTYSDNS